MTQSSLTSLYTPIQDAAFALCAGNGPALEALATHPGIPAGPVIPQPAETDSKSDPKNHSERKNNKAYV